MILNLTPYAIYMIDSHGLIHNARTDLNEFKREFASKKHITSKEAFMNADAVIGLSRPGSFDVEDIKLMAKDPIVFALSNPTPEVFPEDVLKARPDAIIATGRSDFDNQVNNVLGFPFIFRGAMDVRAKKINIEMKVAASMALAKLAQESVPDYLNELYEEKLHFGKDYLIPKPFDKRLIVEISSAVAQAAIDSGVSKLENFNMKEYRKELKKRLK